MKTFKFLSIGAYMALCMGFVSCGEKDDEPTPEVDEYGISLTQEVDLGLPSGTVWAGWNVGASSPEEYGGYYAWGETEEKSDYDYDTYKFWVDNDGDGYWDYDECANIGSNISGTRYDVTRQKWGGSWRMPTKTEFYELTSKCTWTWYQYKGVKGYKVTGLNGNSIFLPAAGYRSGTSLDDDGGYGLYWSASLNEDGYGDHAWGLYFGDGDYYSYRYYYRGYGLTVRPVK